MQECRSGATVQETSSDVSLCSCGTLQAELCNEMPVRCSVLFSRFLKQSELCHSPCLMTGITEPYTYILHFLQDSNASHFMVCNLHFDSFLSFSFLFLMCLMRTGPRPALVSCFQVGALRNSVQKALKWAVAVSCPLWGCCKSPGVCSVGWGWCPQGSFQCEAHPQLFLLSSLGFTSEFHSVHLIHSCCSEEITTLICVCRGRRTVAAPRCRASTNCRQGRMKSQCCQCCGNL